MEKLSHDHFTPASEPMRQIDKKTIKGKTADTA